MTRMLLSFLLLAACSTGYDRRHNATATPSSVQRGTPTTVVVELDEPVLENIDTISIRIVDDAGEGEFPETVRWYGSANEFGPFDDSSLDIASNVITDMSRTLTTVTLDLLVPPEVTESELDIYVAREIFDPHGHKRDYGIATITLTD